MRRAHYELSSILYLECECATRRANESIVHRLFARESARTYTSPSKTLMVSIEELTYCDKCIAITRKLLYYCSYSINTLTIYIMEKYNRTIFDTSCGTVNILRFISIEPILCIDRPEYCWAIHKSLYLRIPYAIWRTICIRVFIRERIDYTLESITICDNLLSGDICKSLMPPAMRTNLMSS